MTLRRKRKWSSSLRLLFFPLSPTDRRFLTVLSTCVLPEERRDRYDDGDDIGVTNLREKDCRSALLRFSSSAGADARFILPTGRMSSGFREITINKKKKEGIGKKKGRKRKEKRRALSTVSISKRRTLRRRANSRTGGRNAGILLLTDSPYWSLLPPLSRSISLFLSLLPARVLRISSS